MKKILSLIVIYFVLTGISWGSNFGSSIDGESASITFSHTSNLDSVHAWFGYDGDGSGADSANLYYWKKLLPCFGNDKIAMADNVTLDSIGTHILKIVYWPIDGTDSIATGIWLHQGVGAVPDSLLGDVSDMANYKTGVLVDSVSDVTKSVTAHVDYDTMLIHAADFKYGGGADSVRAFLAKHDSTLLEQAAATSGAGTEQETLIVLDGDDNAIEGAKISIWNTSGTPYANNITDANGKHVFYLDVDTYIIGTRRVGIHSSTDTLVISADGTDTIAVVAYAPPGAPGSDSVCVEGYVFDLGYTYPTTGLKVMFYLGYETAIKDTSTGVFLEKVVVTADVNSVGYFEVYLPASNNLVNWRDHIAGYWSSADTIFYIVEIKGDTRVVLPPIEGVFIPDTTGCLDIGDIPFR